MTLHIYMKTMQLSKLEQELTFNGILGLLNNGGQGWSSCLMIAMWKNSKDFVWENIDKGTLTGN